jgi:GT2 family glycosyltransferase
MNMGISLAHKKLRWEYLLLLTHDCVLDPTSLQAMLQTMKADPRLGAAGPTLRLPHQVRAFSQGGWVNERRGSVGHATITPGTAVAWLDGACQLVRRDVLANTIFDEGYFLYYEDVDFGIRMRRQGWQLAVVHNAGAQQSTLGMPRYYAVRNRMRLSRKHFSTWTQVIVLTDVLLSATTDTLRELRHCQRQVRTIVSDTIRGLRDSGSSIAESSKR